MARTKRRSQEEYDLEEGDEILLEDEFDRYSHNSVDDEEYYDEFDEEYEDLPRRRRR
jgi:hypothetical protein